MRGGSFLARVSLSLSPFSLACLSTAARGSVRKFIRGLERVKG